MRMMKTLSGLLAIILLTALQPASARGELRSAWNSTKTTVENDFKNAYKQQVKQLEEEISKEITNKKAASQSLESKLTEVGLDKGENLSDYIKFDQGLGPNLDKLETAAQGNRELSKKLSGMQLEDIMAEYPDQFKYLCENVAYIGDEYKFYTEDYKKSPQEIYNEYIKERAKRELNVRADGPGSGLGAAWDQVAQAGTWTTEGAALVTKTRKAAEAVLKTEGIRKFIAPTNKKLREMIGFTESKEVDRLKKQVKEIAKGYKGELQEYQKQWKGKDVMTSEPLKPAIEKLDSILQTVEKW